MADDSSSVYQFFCPQCDRYVPYIGHAVVRVPGLQLEYTNEDRWAAWHRKVDRKVTLIESGEFETDSYDSNDADDLFNASALLDLDRGSNILTPELPTDPDRDQLLITDSESQRSSPATSSGRGNFVQFAHNPILILNLVSLAHQPPTLWIVLPVVRSQRLHEEQV